MIYFSFDFHTIIVVGLVICDMFIICFYSVRYPQSHLRCVLYHCIFVPTFISSCNIIEHE